MTNQTLTTTAPTSRRLLRRSRSGSGGRTAGPRATRTAAWDRTRWAAAEWILGPENTPSAMARQHVDAKGNPR